MEIPDTPDHETGTNPDDAGGPPEWEEDGDRLNEMFAAISEDPLEWAEHGAEMTDWMRDWVDEGRAGDRPD